MPFPPGGGTDIIARETTQRVAAATGWTFVIENRPGAGGNLGVDAAAKSPPDGYTIVLGQTSNLAINPSLYAKMPYDPRKDLAPIVAVAEAPLVMVTGTGSPYKTVADAVAAGKAKPGAVNFASPGNGTVAHLSGELFQKAAGVKFQHVPYKGASQALTDVISGNVQIYVSSVPTLLGQIKQGKLRALAVTSAKRVDDLPRRADARRGRLQGRRIGDLVRLPRPGRHAKGHRGEAERRVQQGAAAAGAAQEARRRGRRHRSAARPSSSPS